MQASHVQRQRLARERQTEEEIEEEEGEDDDLASTSARLPLPKWKRRRQLVREALESSGLVEDLYCVLDGYLGKMEVSELRCVRTIGSRGEGDGQFLCICGISVDAEHIAVWKGCLEG